MMLNRTEKLIVYQPVFDVLSYGRYKIRDTVKKKERGKRKIQRKRVKRKREEEWVREKECVKKIERKSVCEGELSTLAPALCVGAGPISGPQLPLGRRGRHQRHHVRRVRERAPSDGGPGQRDLCYDGRGRCRPHSGKRRRPHCGPNIITIWLC